MDMSEIEKLERAKVGTIKLSEAIRIGAKKRPQCFEKFFTKGGSCAWGAAYEGKTGQVLAPFLDHGTQMGLVCNEYRDYDLRTKVVQMNDSGRTREEIADWLEAKGY